MPDSFTGKFAAGLASYGDRRCIEFEGRWYSGDHITAYADAIASRLHDAGVADGAPVGLVVRNRLPHAAAIIGFLAAGRPVSMIYSFQSPQAIARDIEQLKLARVGQVPFAAVEIVPGVSPPTDDELEDLVRQSLPAYQVPVAFAAIDALPRNPALKVSLPAVAALYPGGSL